MRNKTRKQMQRKVNKAIRALNKKIEEDMRWKGEFTIHQKNAEYDAEDPGLFLLLEMKDRQTGETAEEYLYYTKWEDDFFKQDLFMIMNEFIGECVLKRRSNNDR